MKYEILNDVEKIIAQEFPPVAHATLKLKVHEMWVYLRVAAEKFFIGNCAKSVRVKMCKRRKLVFGTSNHEFSRIISRISK